MDNNYYNNMNENNTNQNNTTNNNTGSAYGTNSSSAYGTNTSQGNAYGTNQGSAYGTAYNPYNGQQNSYNPYQQPNMGKKPKKAKKSGGFGKTLGKCAAIAVIFGLVAGGTFTGTSYIGTKALGIESSTKAGNDSSDSSKKSDSRHLPEVRQICQMYPQLQKRQCQVSWQLQIPEKSPTRQCGVFRKKTARAAVPVSL
jgi:serine protease Do